MKRTSRRKTKTKTKTRTKTKTKTRKRRSRRKLLTNVCRESSVSCQLCVVLLPDCPSPVHRLHCPDSQPTNAPSTTFLFLLLVCAIYTNH